MWEALLKVGASGAAGALLGIFLLYIIAPKTPGGAALLILTCVLIGIVVRGIVQLFRKEERIGVNVGVQVVQPMLKPKATTQSKKKKR